MVRQMLNDMRRCTQIAIEAWERMTLPTGFTKRPCNGYCFRVQFPPNSIAYAISVSVPVDVNSCISDGGEATFETALFGPDGSLIYNGLLGYDDVRRFDTVSQVSSEIRRVYEKIREIEAEGEGEAGKPTFHPNQLSLFTHTFSILFFFIP